MSHLEELLWMIKYLINEDDGYDGVGIPENDTEETYFRLFRALVNIRGPLPISEEFLKIQDSYLKYKIESMGITDYRTLKPAEDGIWLWKGDIVTLKADAIVNAANKELMGCFVPGHYCIDNAIHTFAGVQLRRECSTLRNPPRTFEPTGQAKLTKGYNLPAKYVIHTVGPIVENGRVKKKDCDLLASCYNSCLTLALENNIKSIAFCCISTGVFGFPKDRAAETAVDTVRKFKPKSKGIDVIFNVFGGEDLEIYSRLLSKKN